MIPDISKQMHYCTVKQIRPNTGSPTTVLNVIVVLNFHLF